MLEYEVKDMGEGAEKRGNKTANDEELHGRGGILVVKEVANFGHGLKLLRAEGFMMYQVVKTPPPDM